MPTLFMVELAVADVAAARAWYESALGLTASHTDPATGFVLLSDGRHGRVALKPGAPVPGGVTLHFEVPDVGALLAGGRVVPDGPEVVSREGYCEVFVRDPAGYRVGLFSWDGTREG